MSTGVDTNVLIDLLAGAEEAARRARLALDAAHAQGALVLCPVVYAELLAYPGRGRDETDGLIVATRIRVDWILSPETWSLAGQAFAAYAARRRASGADPPRRLLADFLIGAHALGMGNLLTRDLGMYRTNFPQLRLAPWPDG